ncbi:MAG: lysylphosphatidylglycerol synthase transmembrane domain-containing protein [Gemmatimonadota bacterium]
MSEPAGHSPADSAAGLSIDSILILGGVAALLLWLLVDKLAPASELAEVVARADWRLLPVAVALAVLSMVAAVARWKLVLHAMKEDVPFGECFRIVLGVFPLVLLAPFRSNELLRGVALRRRVPLSTGTGSVIVERLIDILALLLLMAIGSLVGGRPALLLAALAGAVSLCLVAFGLVTRVSLPRARSGNRPRVMLSHFSAAIKAILARPARLSLALSASIVAWLFACALVFVLLAMFGSRLPWHVILTAWPVAALAGSVPITLAGMGTRDGAFLLTLFWSGIRPTSKAAVLAATLGYAALGIWLWILTGIPFLIRLGILEMRARPVDRSPGGRDDAAT